MQPSPCARGCCWSPYGCCRARECPCHAGDWLATAAQPEPGTRTHPDPTANKAIRNIMNERGQR